MHVLDQRIRKSKRNPGAFLLGLVLACGVFICMGLTQLNIDFTPPDEPEPLLEFHMPPPPPPPKEEVPPKKITPVSINFNLPAVAGPADVPLGFLDVDFGLTPKELTKTQINIDDSIDDFQTDGLIDLTIYTYKEVTQPAIARYKPPLEIPARLRDGSAKPFSFRALFQVTQTGRVTDVHILECPYPLAIPKLIEYCKNTRYSPAKKDGKKVNMIFQVRITFNPSGGNPFSI